MRLEGYVNKIKNKTFEDSVRWFNGLLKEELEKTLPKNWIQFRESLTNIEQDQVIEKINSHFNSSYKNIYSVKTDISYTIKDFSGIVECCQDLYDGKMDKNDLFGAVLHVYLRG